MSDTLVAGAAAAAPASSTNPVINFIDRDLIEPVKAFAGKIEAAIEGTPSGPAMLAKLRSEIAAIEAKGADVKSAVVSLAEPIAETALNYALSLIPGGAQFEGLADQVLEQLAAKLEAKRTT